MTSAKKVQDLFSVMGVPLPGRPRSTLSKAMANDMRIHLPANLSEASMKSLTGNGMHVSVVGTLMMCILADVRFCT